MSASHPDEASLLRYADGELETGARHDVESHLMGCRACRAHVVALESESLWLADVVKERARRPVVHAPAPAPEPGVALGVPMAIAFVTAVLAVGGALLESKLPGGLGWMSPMRLMGATTMAFDAIFMLRDRAPGLIELCIGVATVASVSALLSLGVSALGRRVFGATMLALCLLGPRPSHGFELRHQHDGDVRVGAGETVDGTLVSSSEVLYLDGVIDGDLVAVAERITLAGTLRGNLYAFAKRVEITGTVTGSVHGMIESVDVDGSIEGSLYSTSDRLTLGPAGRVGRDVAMLGNDGSLAGRVGRDAFFVGDRLEVRGEVGRNLTARWGAERVTLLDAARIGGDVDVWLHDAADLEQAPGAQVAGEVRTHEPRRARDHYLARFRDPAVWALHAALLVASFLFGLLVRAIAPGVLDAEIATTRQLFSTLGWGFVALLVTPIALLALALTLVGIPIAVLGFFAFVTAIYLAEIVVAVWVGRLVLPARDPGLLAFARTLAVGLVLVVAAEHIPFVGVPIWFVAVLIGLGSLAVRARDALLGERGAYAV